MSIYNWVIQLIKTTKNERKGRLLLLLSSRVIKRRWSIVGWGFRAYSRPILRLKIGCCPLFQTLYNAFWCKTSRKGIEKGEGGFLLPFFQKKKKKKKALFSQNMPFLDNMKRCPKFLEYALGFFIWCYRRTFIVLVFW